MACSKYTLTNTGTTYTSFNYRRCEDSMWQYQVDLEPDQMKTIWFVNNTFNIPQLFEESVIIENEGAFPPESE